MSKGSWVGGRSWSSRRSAVGGLRLNRHVKYESLAPARMQLDGVRIWSKVAEFKRKNMRRAWETARDGAYPLQASIPTTSSARCVPFGHEINEYKVRMSFIFA